MCRSRGPAHRLCMQILDTAHEAASAIQWRALGLQASRPNTLKAENVHS